MEIHEFFTDKRYLEHALIIDHELHGVTPEMLDWWFENLSPERYPMWHPRDHISFKWIVEPKKGRLGAVHEVEEYIGGKIATLRIRGEDPKDIPAEYSHVRLTSVLDEKGESVSCIRHEYESAPFGARMRSTFLLSPDIPKWQTEGLPKHCREEMQSLTTFLPDLYKREVQS